jgi:hypothetical protein
MHHFQNTSILNLEKKSKKINSNEKSTDINSFATDKASSSRVQKNS